MLTELKVANFAIIDKVNVQFKPGFNVLSGETGSGKSVLLKSLALLMGDKSVSNIIKTGSEQAAVEGSFDISRRPDIKSRLIETGITDNSAAEVEDVLIVKRVISQDGKNRVYINGSLSTLHQLRQLVSPLIEVTGHAIGTLGEPSGPSAPLIELTGQHENRHLQSRAFHLDALDQYVGALGKRAKVEEIYNQREKLIQALAELESGAREKSQRLDFLTYQRDEIRALKLRPGEEEGLENEVRLLKDSTKLVDYIDTTEFALYGSDDSALAQIHRTLQKGHEFAGLDGELAERLQTLQQAKTLIEEYVYGLRDYRKKLNENPGHLEEAEEKLSALRKLQKKYGTTVAEILEFLAKVETEISSLENFEERSTELHAQIAALTSQLKKLAKELQKMRSGGALTLAKSVNAELADLNMKGLIFSVRVDELAEAGPTGASEVEFMIQSSKKDQPRALAKFASGGELSRILLALKRVTGASEYPRTYLFDEVDAGVSGVTAEKVGRKLKSIAKDQQVICVTHLPQVAAFAHAHYVISKSEVSGGGIRMTVEELSSQNQVREIARMLSGEKITKSSLEHAKELLGG